MNQINSKNIQLEAKKIVCNLYNIDDISLEKNFLALGDEFDFIELIMKVEDHFEIVISDHQASAITNLNDLFTYLSINCNNFHCQI
jgi:acyl carrier protein